MRGFGVGGGVVCGEVGEGVEGGGCGLGGGGEGAVPF